MVVWPRDILIECLDPETTEGHGSRERWSLKTVSDLSLDFISYKTVFKLPQCLFYIRLPIIKILSMV